MYFVIRKTRAGQFWWRAVGDNHEVMGHSETMTSKQSAQSAIDTIKREAAKANVVDSTGPSDGTSEPS